MSTDAPVTHLEEALKLEADGYVHLFEARLKTDPVTIVRFWNGPTRTWNGHSYEGIACQLTGDGKTAQGELSRPNLTIQNPGNIFGLYAAEGYFDLAEVIRKRVLQQNFINDVAAFKQNVWIVGRVANSTQQILQLELRSPTDMPVWLTPRRTYSPPDYPFVTI